MRTVCQEELFVKNTAMNSLLGTVLEQLVPDWNLLKKNTVEMQKVWNLVIRIGSLNREIN